LTRRTPPTVPNTALDVAFLMVAILSEMNYGEKRPAEPTNRYFQLQSGREFGFM
jgi:hypothetical protein